MKKGTALPVVLIAIGALLATACGPRPCRKGTLLLTIDLGPANVATGIVFVARYDGNTMSAEIAGPIATNETIELEFPESAPYPSGQTMALAATIHFASGVRTQELEIQLDAECTAYRFDAAGGGPLLDLTIREDLVPIAADLSTPDDLGIPDDLAAQDDLAGSPDLILTSDLESPGDLLTNPSDLLGDLQTDPDLLPPPCIPPGQSTCSAGYFCSPGAACSSPGTCAFQPVACPDNFAPVCGCDGSNYTNQCLANLSSVGVKHTGDCP